MKISLKKTSTLRKKAVRVYRSVFVRNVAVLVSGTASAQALSMVFAPVITRLYGPEAFGVYGTFTAILAVGTPIAALSYPIAVILPKRDEEALAMIRLSLYISISVAALLTGVISLGRIFSLSVIVDDIFGFATFWLPVALLFTAWGQMARYWLVRKRAYKSIAVTTLSSSALVNGAKTLMGFIQPVGSVLIAITALGYALNTVLMLIGMSRTISVQQSEPQGGQVPPLSELAWRHRDFAFYRTPQDAINAASQNLPIIMLAGVFGAPAAGYYTLGKIVMGVPSGLIGKSVTDVFYPRVSEAVHRGHSVTPMILNATGGLLAIGIIPFGLIFAFGPWIFTAVFGEQWSEAGEYARWLSLFFLFNLINKPSVAAVPALGIQRGLLVYEVLSTLAKLLGFLMGVYVFNNDLYAVAAFSIIGVVAYSIMIIWIIYVANKR